MSENKGLFPQDTGHLNIDRPRGEEQTRANGRKFEFTFSRANANSLLPSAAEMIDQQIYTLSGS